MTLSFGFLSYSVIYISSFLFIRYKKTQKSYNISPIALFLNNTIIVIERGLRNLSYVLTFARYLSESRIALSSYSFRSILTSRRVSFYKH